MTDVPLKKCKTCGVAHPATEEFFPSYRAKGISGLRGSCRGCHNETMRELVATWRREHPTEWRAIKETYAPRKKALDAQYAAQHPEEKRRASLRWARRHAERIALVGRAWAAANRARRNAQQRLRNAAISGTSDGNVDYVAIVERDSMTCHLCGSKIAGLSDLHFDHIVPLARGGTHTADNIAPSHKRCNLSKGARLQIVT